MIAIEVKFTFQDLLHYTFYKYYRNIGRLVLQGIVLLAAAIWIYEEVSQNTVDLRIRIFVVLSLIYLYLITPIRLFFIARKAYRSNMDFQHPIQVIFEQEYIRTTTKSNVTTHKWELIHKITETKSWLLVYFSQITVTLIPKSAFTTPEQLQALKQLIASKKEIKQSLLLD